MAPENEDPTAKGGAPEGSSDQADPLEFNRCNHDLQPIRVELSERRRPGSVVHIASCSFGEVESSSGPICKLGRMLIAAGHDPRTLMEVWRGSTLCFAALPVSKWAELTVEESAGGPVFRRYRPPVGAVEASQSAESDDE